VYNSFGLQSAGDDCRGACEWIL